MRETSSSGISNTVDSTGEPAFATSSGLRILAWNSAAERTLGHSPTDVIGEQCYEVLEATDGMGDSFCGRKCPLLVTLDQGEPIDSVELWIRCADRSRISATASVFAVPDTETLQSTLVHILSPTEVRQDTDAPLSAGDDEPLIPPTNSGANSQIIYSLTDRETQVLQLLAQGKGTHTMADDLYISPATVRSHIQSITNKLDVHTRLQAVIVANRRRLI